MSEFDGHTILVTGAAGDIGRATARLLSERGAAVVLADVESGAAGLDVTAAACAGSSTTIMFDVTDEAAVTAAIAKLGPLDGVANIAGYQGHFANTLDYDLADVRRVLDINVTGLFAVMQTTARAMVAADQPGSIVNMASMAGVTGAPNMVAYSASKAAVIGMTKSAARDLAPHRIRVNAVSPAFIGSGAMWDRQVELQAETPSQYFSDDPAVVADQMIGSIPMRRAGTLDEVAEVVAFLLSDRSSYLTATNTEVSGGSA